MGTLPPILYDYINRSIYEEINDNRQANVKHMNLKGISQVDINWKSKEVTYKA
jgi:hypothetical protein